MSFNPYPSLYVPQQHIDLTTGIVYHYLALRQAPPLMSMPMLRDDYLRTARSLPNDPKRKGDQLSSSQSKRQRSLQQDEGPHNEEEESDCPLNEEESVSSSIAAVCHLKDEEESEKEYHSGGSTTSSLSDDNSTGCADLRQEQVLLHQEQASQKYDAHRYMTSSLPLPPKTSKSGSLRNGKRLFSTGSVPTSTFDHLLSATGGLVPAPQQLPDHYVLTGCVDSPQEHRRRKAAREYNARRYSAKKLAMAKLKANESESAMRKAIVLGILPACQVTSPMSEPDGANQKGKQAVPISKEGQGAFPLLSTILTLPLPVVKGRAFQPRAVPLPSTMSPLPLPKATQSKPPAVPLPSSMSPLFLPPKARKFQPKAVPLPSSMSPLFLPPKVRKFKPTAVYTLPSITIPLFVPPKLKKYPAAVPLPSKVKL